MASNRSECDIGLPVADRGFGFARRAKGVYQPEHPDKVAAEESVKSIRHAAALAIVGWYMMMPSMRGDYPKGNVDAPLTQWSKRATVYRDQEECEHVLDRIRRNTNAKKKQSAVRYYKQAQCVTADDLRLKPKWHAAA
jgi:hypothetical protein